MDRLPQLSACSQAGSLSPEKYTLRRVSLRDKMDLGHLTA
jgi:hypothetical protein